MAIAPLHIIVANYLEALYDYMTQIVAKLAKLCSSSNHFWLLLCCCKHCSSLGELLQVDNTHGYLVAS